MARKTLFAALILLAAQIVRADPGAAFFTLDLSSAKDLPPGAKWVNEGPNGEPCLRIDVLPKDRGGSCLVTLPIDVKALRDREILLSYDVRAEGVSMPAHDYNGIKAQLHYESASAGPQWFNEGLLTGTFPWKHSSLLVRVDSDASDGVLQLGMQECSGTAWLANVTIQIVRAKPPRPVRLRGVVGSSVYTPQDFVDLAGWKVNVIRWQLVNPDWDRASVPSDPALYEKWLRPKLDELAVVLDQAQKLGIRVIIDLHYPPGGRLADGTLRMVMEKPLQQYFILIWQEIAVRFKGHPALWAYDIMNEPLQNRPSPPGCSDWFDLQAAAAQAVRQIDPDTAILIAADQWDSPEAFAWMRPVNVPNVIYTVHMYWPYEYTHQGVDGRPWKVEADKPAYPGHFNGRPFDRDALARRLQPVREFQLAYGARIFVGEFSVARWAPGAASYLADEISLFEEYGWDWTYHAFRELTAWNLEDSDQPYGTAIPSKTPTDRFRALQPWFQKNVTQP
jgi:hypothetical protein